jgi:hypothetical protein
LRHMDGEIASDALIVPLTVSNSVVSVMTLMNGDYANLVDTKIQSEMTACLSIIDKYLWGNPDLLEKRVIFMTTTAEENRWIGFALFNPWVRLVVEAQDTKKMNESNNMKKKKFDIDTCLSGMVFNNSEAYTASPRSEVVIPLWFLNMASHYRDLRLHDKHTLFNVESMVSMGIPVWFFFFLGHTGPFCNLFDLHDPEENKYPLIYPPLAPYWDKQCGHRTGS